MTPTQELVLYSTWRGTIASFLSPTLLIGVSVVAIVASGRPAPFAVVILVLGIVLAYVALFDHPLTCHVHRHGIDRRSALRRHKIAWDELSALRRSRGSVFGGHRREDASRLGVGMGGLVAARGRRKYLLVNHVESRDEYDALRAAVTEWAPDVALSAPPPPESAPPTWLYHRRRGNRGARTGG